MTAANGSAWGNLTVPADMIGPTGIDAAYAGIAGTTGIVGTNATSVFVVLAQTEVQNPPIASRFWWPATPSCQRNPP